MLESVKDQARLRERDRPYERAGIPEDFYNSLLWDEYETMHLEAYADAIESGEEPEPFSEEARLQRTHQQAYRAWGRDFDRRHSSEDSSTDPD